MSQRKALIAGNWKMFKTGRQAVEMARQLLKLVSGTHDVDIMIAPPFTSLGPVFDVLRGSNVSLGAQNLFWKTEGAYTGEISADMLVDAGCEYVIIGHSERRQFFSETDDGVNKKIQAALQARLIPILCVGETELQRESGETFSVLETQIKKGLAGVPAEVLDTLVMAYEPVWAIGTGKAATSDQAQEVHAFLRSLMEKSFGNRLAKSLKILYGGSVKPGNIKDIMDRPDVDGALVGGASLSAEVFSRLVLFNQN